MYNSQYGVPSGSSSPATQFSNNPFIDDPTSPVNRYPDIGAIERAGSAYASPGASFPAHAQTGVPAGPGAYSANGYSTPSGFGQQPQQQSYRFQPPPPPPFVQQQQAYGAATGAGWQ
ncbi:hypothetical protein EW145_g6850, partial [Phellinidium pouzarii]